MLEPATIPRPTGVQCVECHRPADGPAHDWKAYLGGGYEGEPVEVVIYCPECSERECGDGG